MCFLWKCIATAGSFCKSVLKFVFSEFGLTHCRLKVRFIQNNIKAGSRLDPAFYSLIMQPFQAIVGKKNLQIY